MRILIAVVVLLTWLAGVYAGDPAFCDQYKITSFQLNGIKCIYTPSTTALDYSSDIGDLNSPITVAFCGNNFGETSFSFNFDTTSTATSIETQYTRRTQTLYINQNKALVGSQVVPTPVTYTYGSPRYYGYILKATHEYIGSGGQTETCDAFLRFNSEERKDPSECLRYSVTDISLPGLQCDRPLTGLDFKLTDAYDTDFNYATCIIPDAQAEIRANHILVSPAGTGAFEFHVTDVFNSEIFSATYSANYPDDAVWPFSVPDGRPPYFDMRMEFYNSAIDASGKLSICTSQLRFKLNSASSVPAVDVCNFKTAQECLNNYNQPSGCVYEFPSSTCSSTATDVCQGINSTTTCENAGCFWDSYLSNCLTTLSQVNSVYPCNYWTQFTETLPTPTNDACDFHACLFDPNVQQCLNSNETISQSPDPVISVDARFINTIVDTTALTLSLQAVVPFVYTDATPTNPRFPQFQVLTAVSDYTIYGVEDLPVCSSYQAVDPITPVAFSVIADAVAFNAFLVDWFATNSNFEFDTSENGELAKKVFGKVRVGPAELIRSVAYDGSNLTYNLTLGLAATVADCQSRGAGYSDNDGTRVYNIPLSYIEVSPGPNYSQLLQNFAVTIPTSGTATVGTSTSYGFNAFPVGLTVFKGESRGCLADEARLSIKFQLESYNVFDESVRVGGLSLSSVALRAAESPAGPVNCYGAGIFESTGTVCDYVNGICAETYTVQTACRVIRPDGNTFKLCQYAKDEDRLADFNGNDEQYAPELDGLYTFFVNRRVCPLLQGDIAQCPTTSSRAAGQPEIITAIVLPSVFADESTTTEDFQVESGFLPGIGSGIASKITGTVGEDGILNYVIGQSGIITIYAAMEQSVRNKFDLRANIADGQIRIVPYSASGQPLSTVSGYTGPAELFYGQFRTRLLASAKEDYYAGCGASGSCKLLPACNDILGCDGFAIPVSQLRTLMPASSYQIVMPYRIGLLNNDGSTPIARRRLLQATAPATRIGTATFRFIIDSTGRPVIVDNTNTNSTLVTVDLISAISAPDHDKARLSFYMTSFLIVPLIVIYYAVTAELSKYCSSNK